MNLKTILLLNLAFCTCFLSCKKSEPTVNTKKAAIDVTTALVRRGDLQEYLTFNGVTIYQRKEDIRSNVTGYVTQMRYKVGDAIYNGQVFATVRTKEQDALRDAVKIDSSLARFIGSMVLKSNASGIIKTLSVTKNDYIAEGDILASVVQPQSLAIQLNVPFENRNKIKVGLPCEILIADGSQIEATITKKLATVDALSQTQTYLIELTNADLPEGLSVQVKLLDKESKDVLIIPKSALQTNELLTDYWILKVEHDTLAVKTAVIPTLENDTMTGIIGGDLQPNDQVIIQGAYQMQDSTYINITNQ